MGLTAIAASGIFIISGWIIIECSMLAIAAYRFNKIHTINEHMEEMNKRLTKQSNQIRSSELRVYKKKLLQYKQTVDQFTIKKGLVVDEIESLLKIIDSKEDSIQCYDPNNPINYQSVKK